MSLTSLDVSTPPRVADGHEFKAPGPGDLRSPCPFMNTLANHGYINRSGKRITLWAVVKAIMECFNFNFGIALIVGLTGIYTGTLVGWNPLWFSLDQLKWHSKISIERDASLSRLDYKDGDNYTPNPKRIEEMISFAGSPHGLGVHDFSAYRVFREKPYPQSELPGVIEKRVRCVQVALAMTAAGRGDLEVLGRSLNTGWIKSFFANEKLPDDWSRQSKAITFGQVAEVTETVIKQMKEIREGEKGS